MPFCASDSHAILCICCTPNCTASVLWESTEPAIWPCGPHPLVSAGYQVCDQIDATGTNGHVFRKVCEFTCCCFYNDLQSTVRPDLHLVPLTPDLGGVPHPGGRRLRPHPAATPKVRHSSTGIPSEFQASECVHSGDATTGPGRVRVG